MLNWPDREGYWHIIFACGAHGICTSDGHHIWLFDSAWMTQENVLEQNPELEGAKFLFMFPLIDCLKDWPDSEGKWKILRGGRDGETVIAQSDGSVIFNNVTIKGKNVQPGIFYYKL